MASGQPARRHTDDAHAAIDDAYHAKYDSYGARIVGSVVGPDTHRVTIHLDRSET